MWCNKVDQLVQLHLAVKKKRASVLSAGRNQERWPLLSTKLHLQVFGNAGLKVGERKSNSIAEMGGKSFVDGWNLLFG